MVKQTERGGGGGRKCNSTVGVINCKRKYDKSREGQRGIESGREMNIYRGKEIEMERG